MKKVLALFLLVCFAYANVDSIVIKSASALDRFMALPEEQIPPKLLRKAKAIAIIPNLIRGGFIAGARYGEGILLVRTANGWSDPLFIKLYGASIGWQIGLESIDVVLIFTDSSSVHKLLSYKLTLAADASIAVGPVGRTAIVGTDFHAQILSYSRSMGAYVGIALAGATLEVDYDKMVQVYRCDPSQLYFVSEGKCRINNPYVQILKDKINHYSAWHK